MVPRADLPKHKFQNLRNRTTLGEKTIFIVVLNVPVIGHKKRKEVTYCKRR
jgi:hypothetical protein